MKRRNLLLVAASAAVLCAGLGMTACWGERDLPEDIPMTESFELLADGTYELTRVEWGYSYRENRSTMPEEYTIPSEHEGIPVTSVASGAVGILWRGDESPENVKLSVTIPAGIKHLGRGSIEATTVNWNAVSVEDKEDDWDSSIVSRAETVVFGEGVERIPARSFYEGPTNNTLTSVTLSENITEIGEYAFYGCNELKNIDLPEDLTTIGFRAFCASGLTSVTIPDSVTSIGEGAFHYCDELTSITVPFIGGSREENRQFAYICEKDFSTETPLSVTVTGGTDVPESAFSLVEVVDDIPLFYPYEYIESITLPETVTSIGGYAFAGCSGLTSVTIPDGVTSIGNWAFSGCRGLTSVTIPDGVTSIGSSAFSGCSGLTSVTIPDGVTSVGSYAFEGCSNLESITLPFVGAIKDGTNNTHFGYIFGANSFSDNSENVPTTLKTVIITGGSSIGENAFSGCSGLTSVTIGNGVTFIGSYAFSGCSAEIKWGDNPTITEIGSYAFANYTGTSITIPDSVTSIGDYAFEWCGITNITIPNGLQSIGEEAFENCENLETVHISDVARWCGISFTNSLSNPLSYANNLYLNGTLVTDLTIPDEVISINDYAFYNCSSLTCIVLPENLMEIGNYAFYGCGLEEFTVPLNAIFGDSVLQNCNNLNDIYFKGDFANYIQSSVYVSHYYHLHLWNGTEYYEPTSAEVFPSQLGILGNISSLTEIICKYEEGNTNVEFYISGFPSLKTVKLEYLEDEIKIYQLNYPSYPVWIEISLASNIQVTYGYNLESSTINGFDYIKRGNSVMLTAYSGNAERIILPAQIEGVAITKLGSIFKNNTTVKEVVIPEGYTEIADETFYGCTALEIVYIPSTITKMGENVFYNNNMAYNAPSNLPFANDGSYILSGIYTSLSSLSASTGNWTDKAYFIHKNSHFDADSKIIYEYGGGIEEPRILRYSGTDSTVTVPATIENIAVKEIYYCAFYGIQTLNSVTFPEGIESIGKSAFEGCSALQNVSLPQSLTTIAAGAFKDCSNLTTITIPRAVKMIGDHVFTGCSALASISFELPTGWISYTFTDTGANPDSAQSHDMSDTAECVTVLRDSYAERMFVNSGANTTTV